VRFEFIFSARRLHGRKQLGILLAQGRHFPFELALNFGEVVFDQLFILQIIGNRAIRLRERNHWKRLDDLFRSLAFLKMNDNGTERHTSA
jgi:hypothetical protein